jgi:hypothetical protein
VNPYDGADAFPVSVDLPDDSDPPAAATFNVALEGLADRTIALANGYRNQLADLNALAAIDTTSFADGATRFVLNLGMYRLDKTVNPTFTEDRPAVVAPTTGTGRWYAQDIALIDYEKTFTGSGTWTCPPNIMKLRVRLQGGGGGGGGGAGGDLGTTSLAMAGAGGAAGAYSEVNYVPHTGAAHTYAAGAGGAGGALGAGASSGTDGDDGATSYIEWASDATKIVQGLGGQGGAGGVALASNSADQYMRGGKGFAGMPLPLNRFTTGDPPELSPSDGGYSANANSGANLNTAGAPSASGFQGGTAGVRGATHTHGGGGGGGGGGASLFANGGNGGNGGDGAASGDGANGSSGSAPIVANSGAGGGGGGAGGSGSSNSATGAAGGDGEDGVITIRAVA